MNLPEITEIQRLTLKPGDRLIVRAPRQVSMAEADCMQARVRSVLGLADDFPVLILPEGMSLEAAGGLREVWGYKDGKRVYAPEDTLIEAAS